MPEDYSKDKVDAAYKEGVLDQRLAVFDNRFAAINGSIERTATELNRLRLLLEEQLANKVGRESAHKIANDMAGISLRVSSLEQQVVRREGPIAEKIDTNTRRLDVLEAGQPAITMKVKHEIEDELDKLRDGLKDATFGGSIRRWTAAGAAFAGAFGLMVTVSRALGLW